SPTRRSGSASSPATTTSRRRHVREARTATRVGMRRSPRWRWSTCSIASMPRTRVETRARARVLQALYAWDLRGGGKESLERVAHRIWDDLAVPADERQFAKPLVDELS